VKIIDIYGDAFPELSDNKDFILSELQKESILFSKTLDSGLKKAEKYFNDIPSGSVLNGDSAFKLYDTFGFPIEFTRELASEKGILIDMDRFNKKFREHQAKSRLGSEIKFKGGMADNSEQTTKLHTATHLLNGALRTVLGNSIYQKGSNITPERLRFDFSFERKLTEEELKKVSDIVNEVIRKEVDIVCEEMTIEEAKNSGAVGVFESKYGQYVKVYTISEYSKEICGGPHVNNTRELGSFKIIKEESSSSGVRRIKAVTK
jgi:alanyl-tRNA synthetase